MANTYCKILLHLVFAVKHRDASIMPIWQGTLHGFIASTLRNKGCWPIKIGGTNDHVHVFFSYNPVNPLPELVRTLKSSSSKFINDHQMLPCRFEWQKGYACFSYSASQVEIVSRYIENQYEHHKGHTLVDEIRNMLIKFGIEYDERYIFTEME